MFFSKHAAESDRSIIQNANSKKASIQKLKKELEQLEKDTETRLREIDRDNAELKVKIVLLLGQK